MIKIIGVFTLILSLWVWRERNLTVEEGRKGRVDALFEEIGTNNKILLYQDGKIEFYFSNIEDGNCGSFRCTWEYDIYKKPNLTYEINVLAPSSKINRYWDIYIDTNGDLIWKHSEKHISIYKQIESEGVSRQKELHTGK